MKLEENMPMAITKCRGIIRRNTIGKDRLRPHDIMAFGSCMFLYIYFSGNYINLKCLNFHIIEKLPNSGFVRIVCMRTRLPGRREIETITSKQFKDAIISKFVQLFQTNQPGAFVVFWCIGWAEKIRGGSEGQERAEWLWEVSQLSNAYLKDTEYHSMQDKISYWK